jgi:hypothetical protein
LTGNGKGKKKVLGVEIVSSIHDQGQQPEASRHQAVTSDEQRAPIAQVNKKTLLLSKGKLCQDFYSMKRYLARL